MTTDLVLLTIQTISMALLVSHCPPIRRIAFQFLRLCQNLLVGVDISGSSGITDVVPEFLETGCRGVLHHLMYLCHLQTMLVHDPSFFCIRLRVVFGVISGNVCVLEDGRHLSKLPFQVVRNF